MKISNGSGKALKILITAGPTVEKIDPVRFMSNRSTGYMGYELASEARRRGCPVTLISGPTCMKPPKAVRFLRIESARELYTMVHKELSKADVLIMTSAVCDFKPTHILRNKIKKANLFILKLRKNKDILASLSKRERENKFIAGFALETKNLLGNAQKKLEEKSLDLIVCNKADKRNMPFGTGLKTVYLLDKCGRKKKLEKKNKVQIARAILDTIEELCYTPN
ncbi:MAG: phosphopantothenoylcysteine decarboxylase [Candidatus Omnitrophota bacterium]